IELIAVSRIAPGCQQINVKFAQQATRCMRNGMLPVRFDSPEATSLHQIRGLLTDRRPADRGSGILRP
ncbi:MAG: hypothetical protein EBU75_08265, partial [Betaproteobacteria bacterium]|nr:hypothetical protein [Betaproteobacteria bacterium]